MTGVFLSVPRYNRCAPLSHLPYTEPHSRVPKKNTSHGNEVLPQDTTHLIQRPCYQRGSPSQHPAGNRTTRRPDHRKETQTAEVWSCLLFIRSGQNHLAKHSEKGKKTRQTEDEGGKTTSGNGQFWRSPSPKGQWKTTTTTKMEETDCEVICGASTTPVVRE